jgi:hypothetical protein
MPAPSGGGAKGGGGSVKGGAKAPSRTQLAPNVAPNHSVPAHMARRIEKGHVDIKGRWKNWPGMEEK